MLEDLIKNDKLLSVSGKDNAEIKTDQGDVLATVSIEPDDDGFNYVLRSGKHSTNYTRIIRKNGEESVLLSSDTVRSGDSLMVAGRKFIIPSLKDRDSAISDFHLAILDLKVGEDLICTRELLSNSQAFSPQGRNSISRNQFTLSRLHDVEIEGQKVAFYRVLSGAKNSNDLKVLVNGDNLHQLNLTGSEKISIIKEKPKANMFSESQEVSIPEVDLTSLGKYSPKRAHEHTTSLSLPVPKKFSFRNLVNKLVGEDKVINAAKSKIEEIIDLMVRVKDYKEAYKCLLESKELFKPLLGIEVLEHSNVNYTGPSLERFLEGRYTLRDGELDTDPLYLLSFDDQLRNPIGIEVKLFKEAKRELLCLALLDILEAYEKFAGVEIEKDIPMWKNKFGRLLVDLGINVSDGFLELVKE